MPAHTHILKHMPKSVLVIQGYAINLVSYTVDFTVNFYRTISQKIQRTSRHVLNAAGLKSLKPVWCLVLATGRAKHNKEDLMPPHFLPLEQPDV